MSTVADGWGVMCIHCGAAPIAFGVFCSRECQATCLAECGSKSTLGT